MYIKVYVTPNSRKEIVEKESPTTYRIKVREPKERNLANIRLRQILASEFGTKLGQVKIVSGHRSPTKVFDVLKV
jgi:uncharacterized protein YggU (UPF0235/DUF167 family)